jgi:hypothetical protein
VPTLARLLRAGVTCARVDLSWGTRVYHEASLANLAEAMRQTRLLCRWVGAGTCTAVLFCTALHSENYQNYSLDQALAL